MIRYEVTRDLPAHLRRAKGRNAVPAVSVSFETDVASAIAAIGANHHACEEIAPGYMPIVEARLYDDDAFRAWVRNGGEMPAPVRVLSRAEIEALPRPEPVADEDDDATAEDDDAQAEAEAGAQADLF